VGSREPTLVLERVVGGRGGPGSGGRAVPAQRVVAFERAASALRDDLVGVTGQGIQQVGRDDPARTSAGSVGHESIVRRAADTRLPRRLPLGWGVVAHPR
jgi:hypothetical protein